MARVPTWTELRLDANKLASLQKECQRSVYDLLDSIPKLDEKISLLLGRHVVQSKDSVQRKDIIQRRDIVHKEVHTPSNDVVQNKDVVEASSHVVKESSHVETNKEDLSLTDSGIEELEHLKSLPLPLSTYLKMNRPDVVMNADRRVMYLQEKAERRKLMAPRRMVSSLDRIKLSPRSNDHLQSRDYVAPEYNVKDQFSEKEMKRLTAKTYRRLPEVRKKCREEITNHMKVQNYKNRLEYGRRLLENRKLGIINYSLKPMYTCQ